MAHCIPDRIPRQASQGEVRLFNILSKLPDDCIVYYEPIVENRYPDFLVLIPSIGLIVIEVKGWRHTEVLGGDLENVLVNYRGTEQRQRHPIRQAREYMLSLMDSCQRHKQFQNLIHGDGVYQGRFIFPFAYFSVLSNITQQQLEESGKGVLFPKEKVMTRDELLKWEELSTEALLHRLKSYFDPWWPITTLSGQQIDTMRAIIHPEVMLLPFKDYPLDQPAPDSIKVLDFRQETHARSVGNGHRILYGVPGSGKTVILVARAKLVAQANSAKQFLFICYNLALSLFLRSLLADTKNVTVRHFDGWCRDHDIRREQNEENDSVGARLLAALQNGRGDTRKYTAAFIDEAQDFSQSWFSCVLEAMEDPLDGDLLIVGDGNQGLYRNRQFTWADAGIQAVGRTINTKFDLDRCYRSTREIITLAKSFASAADAQPEMGIASMPVDPLQCVRASGFRPVMLRCKTPEDECQYTVALVAELLNGKWFGRDLPQRLQPAEIGVLYRKAPGDQYKRLLGQLEKNLGKAVWLSRDRTAMQRLADPLVKIQTIHSAKGLQFKAVILLWGGQMPSAQDGDDPSVERKLMFVSLTRAEDYLSVLYSSPSTFMTELVSSNAADVLGASA